MFHRIRDGAADTKTRVTSTRHIAAIEKKKRKDTRKKNRLSKMFMIQKISKASNADDSN